MPSKKKRISRENEAVVSAFPCGSLDFYDDTLESIDSSILFLALHRHFIGQYGPINKTELRANAAALGNTNSGEIVSAHFDGPKKFMIVTEIDGLDCETKVMKAD